MAKKFVGISDGSIFSADCKHRFSVPREAGGKYTVTMPGRPQGDTAQALTSALEDTTVNVQVKLPDLGQITSRTTTEKDVDGGKFVAGVKHYAGVESESVKPQPRKRGNRGANRLEEKVGANGQS